MLLSNPATRDARVLREARSLVKAGHEVTILGWDRRAEAPREESVDGVRIRRLRNTALMRMAAHDLFRNPLWWRLAAREGLKEDFDLVHCHDLDTLSAGVRLKERRGVPLLYDAHEIFAYMIEGDLPAMIVSYAERLEAGLLPSVDALITVNDRLEAYYAERTRGPIRVVMNCPEKVLETYEPPAESVFTLLYIGTLHRARFVLELVDVVGAMDGVRLVIGGEKALTPEVAKRCTAHDNVTFLGAVPLEEVLPWTRRCHAVFCLFDPRDRNNQVGSPNKIFEAMAMGRPVLATKGIWSGEFVERIGCGVTLDYAEDALQETVVALSEDPARCEAMGRKGLDAARAEYNWEAQAERLLRLVDELT